MNIFKRIWHRIKAYRNPRDPEIDFDANPEGDQMVAFFVAFSR